MTTISQIRYSKATKQLADSIGLEVATEAVLYLVSLAEADSFKDKIASLAIWFTAKHFGLDPEYILTKGSYKEVNRVRSMLYCLLADMGFSNGEIAKTFNTSKKRVIVKKRQYLFYKEKGIDKPLLDFESQLHSTAKGLTILFAPPLSPQTT